MRQGDGACLMRPPDEVVPTLAIEILQAVDGMATVIAAGDDHTEADAALHRTIVLALHNPLIARLFESLYGAVERTSAASLSIPGRPPPLLEAHRAIVEAIADRDAPRAASEMTSHIRRSARAVASDT